MGYYQDKVRANRIIDEMFSLGCSIDEIEFKISTQFGFSRKFIEKRTELIECISKK